MDELEKKQGVVLEKASELTPGDGPGKSSEQARGVETMQTLSAYEDEFEEPKLSALERMIKIFTSPSEVFADIPRKKGMALPLVAIMVTGIIVAFLEKDSYVAFTTSMMSTQGKLTAEQIQASMSMLGMVFLLITPLALLVNIFVKGVASHLLSIPLEGKGMFSETVAVVAYAYVIQILGMVLQCVATLATGTFGISFSPALLLPNDQMMTPLYTFLSMLSIFNIWYLTISVIGISIVHKTSKAKAAIIVLVPFVASILFSVVPMLLK